MTDQASMVCSCLTVGNCHDICLILNHMCTYTRAHTHTHINTHINTHTHTQMAHPYVHRFTLWRFNCVLFPCVQVALSGWTTKASDTFSFGVIMSEVSVGRWLEGKAISEVWLYQSKRMSCVLQIFSLPFHIID